MKEFIRNIVNITHIISFCMLLVIGVMGVIYELIGHVRFERLLKTIGVSNSFDKFWILGVVVFFVLLITYFLKAKIFVK